jgi:hypothetical protein
MYGGASYFRCLITKVFQCLKLSAFAAQALVDAKELEMGSLELHRASQPSPFIQQPLLTGSNM